MLRPREGEIWKPGDLLIHGMKHQTKSDCVIFFFISQYTVQIIFCPEQSFSLKSFSLKMIFKNMIIFSLIVITLCTDNDFWTILYTFLSVVLILFVTISPLLDTGLWLVNTDHVTWILASDWARHPAPAPVINNLIKLTQSNKLSQLYKFWIDPSHRGVTFQQLGAIKQNYPVMFMFASVSSELNCTFWWINWLQ